MESRSKHFLEDHRNIVVIIIFAIAVGTFCNILGNILTQSVNKSTEFAKNGHLVSIAVQFAIAAFFLMIAIGMAYVYRTNVV
jgi:hypothetical protein